MSSTGEIIIGIILAIVGGLMLEYGDSSMMGAHLAWIGWIVAPAGVGLLILGFIHKAQGN